VGTITVIFFSVCENSKNVYVEEDLSELVAVGDFLVVQQKEG